jgi:hypothetical protein
MVFLLGYYRLHDELLESTCLALMDSLASCYDLYSWLTGMISLEDGYDTLLWLFWFLCLVVMVSLLGGVMVSILGWLAWSP